MTRLHHVKKARKAYRKDGIKKGEIWLDVVGFEGIYLVSTWGNVKRIKKAMGTKCRNLRLNPDTHGKGYITVYLRKDGVTYKKYVHDLVLRAFIGPPKPGQQCRHDDGVPWHNEVWNLLWGTPKQNQLDRIRHRTSNRGHAHGMAKLTDDEVMELRRLKSLGWIHRKLAVKFGISKVYVGQLVNLRSRLFQADREVFRGKGAIR